MTTYSEENFLPQSGLATAIGKAQFYADKSMQSATSEHEKRYRNASIMWSLLAISGELKRRNDIECQFISFPIEPKSEES